MKKINAIRLIVIFFVCCFTVQAQAYSQTKWQNWVKNLRHEALAQGIRPNVFDYVFRNVTPSKKHIQLDRNQPESRLTFLKYRRTRGDAYRIKLGRIEFKKYHALLNTIGNEYGVSPCYIVSLWGMESSYGRFMGGYSTIRSLATLAYDGRRSAFFRKELLHALHMLNDEHVSLKDLKGEWAGGTGQPQFLPSSWHHYAVDYNHDGKKDIWKTHADIFASIANYLKQNGWVEGQPWGLEVTVPRGFNQKLIGYDVKKPLQDWLLLGVKANNPRDVPHQNYIASVIKPYGGPYLLIFNNFRVLLKWNYSSFYAGTIGYMANRICLNNL